MPKFNVENVKRLMAEKGIQSIAQLAKKQFPAWNTEGLQQSFAKGTMSDARIRVLAEFFHVPMDEILVPNVERPSYESVDYDSWHQNGIDLLAESPNPRIFGTVTFCELPSLWSNRELFVRYEAFLATFVLRQNNQMRRIFVFTGMESDDARRIWLRTVWRHHQLQFAPRVLAWVRFRKAIKQLEQKAPQTGDEFAAVMYDEFALFCRYPAGHGPLMFRNSEPSIVKEAMQCHKKLWDMSSPLVEWSKSHSYPSAFNELDQEIQQLVLADIQAVKAAGEI